MKNNFIIISEHRVGSRWMHYLFAELLGMKPSPEMDRDRLTKATPEGASDGVEKTHMFLKEGRIPKFHRATYWDIESNFGEGVVKVLGVVRNPRDRAVSLAFHNRYHKNHHFRQKDFKTDQEAVDWTVLYDKGYKKGNLRQLSLMIPGHYVLNSYTRLYPYTWVDYDFLLKNTKMGIERIVKTLDLETKKNIDQVIVNNSFKAKSKRSPGQESRSDLWRRKGISKDWLNWFSNDEVYEASIYDDTNYYTLLNEDYWA